MGRRNRHKTKTNYRNMITTTALNNPHIHNLGRTIDNNIRNAATGKVIEQKDTKFYEYFEDRIKFTDENGDITYYFYN